MIQRTLGHDRLLLLVAAALLVVSAFTIWQARVSPEPAAGVSSAEVAGPWVTSSWPTTRYYTDAADEPTWREWSAVNRVWFDTESNLLRVYPDREKRGK